MSVPILLSIRNREPLSLMPSRVTCERNKGGHPRCVQICDQRSCMTFVAEFYVSVAKTLHRAVIEPLNLANLFAAPEKLGGSLSVPFDHDFHVRLFRRCRRSVLTDRGGVSVESNH